MKILRSKNQRELNPENQDSKTKGSKELAVGPIHSEYQFHFNHGPHSAKFGYKTTETTKKIRPRRKINAAKRQSIQN